MSEKQNVCVKLIIQMPEKFAHLCNIVEKFSILSYSNEK